MGKNNFIISFVYSYNNYITIHKVIAPSEAEAVKEFLDNKLKLGPILNGLSVRELKKIALESKCMIEVMKL